MVTLNFANVHLDTHAVLVGDFNLVAFHPIMVGDTSIGPPYLYVMFGVLAVNVAFITLFYRQLKITTFDPGFARSLGMRTGLLNTAFMFLVSVTVTAAFNAAGAILVIALVVVPPRHRPSADQPSVHDDRVDDGHRHGGGAGRLLALLRPRRRHERRHGGVLRSGVRHRVRGQPAA